MSPVPDAAKRTTIQGLREQIRRHPDRPVILTEGDSWFSYPLHSNTIDHLERQGRFSVLRLEDNGDELLHILSGKSLRRLHRMLDRTFLTRAGKDYRAEALLLSAGGNDLLGDQFAHLVCSCPGGRSAADFIRQGRARRKFSQIEAAIEELLEIRDDFNPECVVYAHGYDYVIPSDRPLRILWGLKKIGPWLHKSMSGQYREDVFIPASKRAAVARWFVDRYNELLADIERRRPGFVHVDTRRAVKRDEWGDEIHPRSKGFEKVARRFERSLRKQFPNHF